MKARDKDIRLYMRLQLPLRFFFFNRSNPLEFIMSDTEPSSAIDIDGLTDYKGWGPLDHDNADLKIISSDNYLFWVPSKHLMHYS